jgi:hypothetical protein
MGANCKLQIKLVLNSFSFRACGVSPSGGQGVGVARIERFLINHQIILPCNIGIIKPGDSSVVSTPSE